MPAVKKTAQRPSAAAAARARDDDHRLERVMRSLESAQKDLAAIGGSVGAGAGDLRRDVKRLVRDASRDVGRMRRAVQRDLARLQKDLAKAGESGSRARSAAKPKPKAKAATGRSRAAKAR